MNVLIDIIMSTNKLNIVKSYINQGLNTMKNDYERNIKVTMNEVHQGETRRSSTTLNYGICNYFFGKILYPKKAKLDKRYKEPEKVYRAWLVATVTDWAKTQPQARSDILERTLLELIYTNGYKQGLDKNKDNNSLDF